METPAGMVLGYVVQNWSLCKCDLTIQNANGEKLLGILGPCCVCDCFCENNFVVYDVNENPVGNIQKQFSGLIKEAFTDADNFGITFPMDLEVNSKALLLGTVFLVDFMYFEKSGNRNDQGAA